MFETHGNIIDDTYHQKEYTKKSVKDWEGPDCQDWATDTELSLDIPVSSWVSLNRFSKISGRELLKKASASYFKEHLVNEHYGAAFYEKFKEYCLGQKKQDKRTKYMAHYLNMPDSYENSVNCMQQTSWMVPDLESQLYFTESAKYEALGYSSSLPQNSDDSFLNFNETGAYNLTFNENLMTETEQRKTSKNKQKIPKQERFMMPEESWHPNQVLGYDYRNSGSLNQTSDSQFYYHPSASSTPVPPEISSPSPNYFSIDSQENSFGRSMPLPFGSPPAISNLTINDSYDSYSYENSTASGYTFAEPRMSGFSDSAPPIPWTVENENAEDSIVVDGIRIPTLSEMPNIDGLPEITDNDFSNLPEVPPDTDNVEYITSEDFFINDLANIDPSEPLEVSMLKKIRTGKGPNKVRNPQSWEYILRLLCNPNSNPSLIRWVDCDKGTFMFVQGDKIAKMWGERGSKARLPLSYHNFARGIRHYYSKGLFQKFQEKHFIYQMGEILLSRLKKYDLLP